LIRQDTLIVAGTDDPIIPVANARIMAALLPHATLHLHPGGHTDLITNAAELAPVIEAFRGYYRPSRRLPRHRPVCIGTANCARNQPRPSVTVRPPNDQTCWGTYACAI